MLTLATAWVLVLVGSSMDRRSIDRLKAWKGQVRELLREVSTKMRTSSADAHLNPKGFLQPIDFVQ